MSRRLVVSIAGKPVDSPLSCGKTDRAARMVPRTLAACPMIAAACAAGCAPGVQTYDVTPARAGRVAAEFARHRTASVSVGSGEIVVRPDNEPRWILRVRVGGATCMERNLGGAWRADCGGREWEVEPDALVVGPDSVDLQLSSTRSVSVPLADIEQLRLKGSHLDPPGWRPVWGIGGAIGGPAIAGVVGQVLPTRGFGLEYGLLPGGRSSILSFAGRIRPIALGRVRPFLGAFYTAYASCSDSSGCEGNSAGGFRVGADVEVEAHWLLSGEIDGVAPRGPEHQFIAGLRGRVIPWGGVACSYFF